MDDVLIAVRSYATIHKLCGRSHAGRTAGGPVDGGPVGATYTLKPSIQPTVSETLFSELGPSLDRRRPSSDAETKFRKLLFC